MITPSEYERGKIDGIIEIYNAAKEGKDAFDKMNKLLDKTILMIREFNKKYIKELTKK